jgi:hypothetical protein
MKKLEIVNPGDRSWTRQRFILAFGDMGWTKLLVWANSVDDALDEAVDWIEDHAPGLLCDDEVTEAYEAAIAEGKSEEEAMAEATVDTTCAGNHGRYLNSQHWTIWAENPTREQIKTLQSS